ncbi:MAG: histidinol dehydrogenase [Bacteroidota bacterium]
MKTYQYPERSAWADICARPVFEQQELMAGVRELLDFVQRSGDAAVRELTRRFDGIHLDDFFVSEPEFEAAIDQVDEELKDAIALAANNIRTFHNQQFHEVPPVDTARGVSCWRQNRPIEKVGLYIPGGTAPLFSSLLMLAIPAQLAGCQEIIISTPAGKSGKVHPAILYTAQFLGLKKVLKLGGAQAVAAMAYGTETVPNVYKIFGPGNQYVTAAKILVQEAGVAIDMPAGPSELLVIADKQARPAFVASDLLSQAEHGVDSQVIFVTDDQKVLEETLAAVEAQVQDLPRRETARAALASSKAVLVADLNEAVAFSNTYAPEHLIIATENALELADYIINAGSVFLGNWTPESVGDYASGTNHTLPTNGAARAYSGVSLDSFQKKITFQRLDRRGIEEIGPAVVLMAEAEQLRAHADAVSLRLQALAREMEAADSQNTL